MLVGIWLFLEEDCKAKHMGLVGGTETCNMGEEVLLTEYIQ